MAAHLLCHGNETLPTSFPAPRPTARHHSMMSEYEAAVIMQPSVPYPEVENSLEVTFDEELPTFRKPSPTHHQFEFSDFYDPTLCVTPEKSSFRRTQLQNLNKGSDIGLSLKPSHSQKVRFENFVEVKEMTPEGAASSEHLAASNKAPDIIEREPVLSNAQMFADLEPFQENNTESSPAVISHGRKTPELNDSHSPSISLTGSSDHSTDEVEIVSILASDMNKNLKVGKSSKSNAHPPKQSKKERTSPASGARPKGRNTNLSSIDVASKVSQPVEHILARPEFNSTLRVSRELQQVSSAQLDVEAAVKQRLQNSRRTKENIKDKVSGRVNAAGPLYTELVSVDVQESDLIGAAEREKSGKVRPTAPGKGAKPQDVLVSPPDILDCFSPHLIRESASYTLEGLPVVKNEPRLASHDRAFDVFRHVRSWENW